MLFWLDEITSALENELTRFDFEGVHNKKVIIEIRREEITETSQPNIIKSDVSLRFSSWKMILFYIS